VHPFSNLARTLAPVLTVAAFSVSVLVSLVLVDRTGVVSPLWTANAFLVTGLLFIKPAHRLATVVACAIANIAVYLALGDPAGQALAFTAANIGEALGVFWLMGQARIGARLTSLRKVARLVAFAILPATALASAFAAAYSTIGDEGFLEFISLWFASDFLGMAIVLPCSLLLLAPQKAANEFRRAAPEILVLAAAAALLFVATPPQFRIYAVFGAFPATTALAFRRGPRATAAVCMLTAAIALPILLLMPVGRTVNPAWHIEQRVTFLQFFLAAWFFTGIVAAMAMADQRRLRILFEKRTGLARAARAEAQAASRAKTDFLATMSHEIRTPMNSIIGFTEVIQRKGGLPPETTRQIAMIERAGSALMTVLNDILDFSKVEAGEVELSLRPCHIAAVAEDSLAIVAETAERKGVKVAMAIEGDPELVHMADDHRLRQVLLNLLNNAIKFTDSGTVELKLALTAHQASFRVVDTGRGIPEDAVGRLFGRFSQIDGSISREHGGTGLGLAICKGLVGLMGGTIGVESVLGKGSTFWFEIPASLATAEAVQEVHGEQAGITAHILLVDDHPMNRELAQTILALLGCTCDLAADGQEAIDAAMTRRYDAILMDVHMPGIDGLAATRAIRALPGPAALTPIIAMSAGVLPEQVERCRAAGMVDAVGKPIDIETLHACLERWIGRDADGQEVQAA